MLHINSSFCIQLKYTVQSCLRSIYDEVQVEC